MNNIPILLVIIPFISAPIAILLAKLRAKLRDYFSVLAILSTFVLAVLLFPTISKAPIQNDLFTFSSIKGLTISINLDLLSLFIITLISFVGCLATLYSTGYMKSKGLSRYYTFLLLFIGAMNGTVLAGDLFTMFFFWELMTLSAFFLVIFHNDKQSINAGIKYFIMSEIGALCMLLSIAVIFFSEGTVNIVSLSNAKLALQSNSTHLLLLLFLIGAGVKAGMFPLHTWLPDAHPVAPSPVSALLSGVMIKVGIYLMLRIFWQIFVTAISWHFILCALGSLTILIGVMMALVQTDAKRLLAYHSVSQVGYMILGIGTGISIGVAGGLFHLLNHALFKGLLFLCIGAVIYRTRTRDLSKYGGLSKFMPVTFVCCLVASLSISGVPPFNGFFSKWMIYQGIIESGKQGHQLWILWLVAAIFGSSLTLASFMKLLHAIFLSRPHLTIQQSNLKEAPWPMRLPIIILASLCILFGVFAYQIPLKYLILPCVPNVSFIGFWSPTLATFLIILGLFAGGFIYLAGKIKSVRVSSPYIGGEEIKPEMNISGVDFYRTIEDMGLFKSLYGRAKKGYFDIYNWAKGTVFYIFRLLSAAHSGILPTYLIWCLVGFLILLFVLRG